MSTTEIRTEAQAEAVIAAALGVPAPPSPTGTASKLEEFIRCLQNGQSVPRALTVSGLISEVARDNYIPGVDDELEIEELYFARAAARHPKVLSDEEFWAKTPAERQELHKGGHLANSEVYKLVDWLYFSRGVPLLAIAASLQITKAQVVAAKAAISNDFAKSIKAQNADSYIGDLLRVKDLIRGDIMRQKSKLSVTDGKHVQLNRLLWEIENKYVDRLQEVGIINKTLGRLEVHEEWEVTLNTAGQPITNRIDAVSSTMKDDIFDCEATAYPDATSPPPDSDESNGFANEDLEQGRSAAQTAVNQSAFIKVGGGE